VFYKRGWAAAQHAGFPQAFRDALDIFRSFEGLAADVSKERIFRVDVHQFRPHPPRVFDLAKVAEG